MRRLKFCVRLISLNIVLARHCCFYLCKLVMYETMCSLGASHVLRKCRGATCPQSCSGSGNALVPIIISGISLSHNEDVNTNDGCNNNTMSIITKPTFHQMALAWDHQVHNNSKKHSALMPSWASLEPQPASLCAGCQGISGKVSFAPNWPWQPPASASQWGSHFPLPIQAIPTCCHQSWRHLPWR